MESAPQWRFSLFFFAYFVYLFALFALLATDARFFSLFEPFLPHFCSILSAPSCSLLALSSQLSALVCWLRLVLVVVLVPVVCGRKSAKKTRNEKEKEKTPFERAAKLEPCSKTNQSPKNILTPNYRPIFFGPFVWLVHRLVGQTIANIIAFRQLSAQLLTPMRHAYGSMSRTCDHLSLGAKQRSMMWCLNKNKQTNKNRQSVAHQTLLLPGVQSAARRPPVHHCGPAADWPFSWTFSWRN